MPDFPVHVQFPGRLVFVGFGSIGQGVLPLVLRHIGIKPERITIVTADEARQARGRGVRHQVRRQPADARQLPAGARAADRPRRFPAEPVGRRVEHRADQVRAREGRAVSGYLHRAVARRLHRSVDLAGAAHQLRAARGSAGAAQVAQERSDGGADARRESRPGVALREAGAAQSRVATPASPPAIRARASSGRRSRTSCR